VDRSAIGFPSAAGFERPAADGALPVRVGEVIRGDGEREISAAVPCPRSATAKSLDECVGCERFRGLHLDQPGAPLVQCAHGAEPSAAATALGHGLGASLSEAASTPVGSLPARHFSCVTADVSTELVTALLLAGADNGVPVVDDEGKPIGIVTRADLLRQPQDGLAPRTVADVMTPLAIGLPETTTVAYAAALMAHHGIHQVPIVRTTGEVVGILTSLDILRWLGTRAGYVVFGGDSGATTRT